MERMLLLRPDIVRSKYAQRIVAVLNLRAEHPAAQRTKLAWDSVSDGFNG